jgi:hypothetical protein
LALVVWFYIIVLHYLDYRATIYSEVIMNAKEILIKKIDNNKRAVLDLLAEIQTELMNPNCDHTLLADWALSIAERNNIIAEIEDAIVVLERAW